jgi:hypothetical protein
MKQKIECQLLSDKPVMRNSLLGDLMVLLVGRTNSQGRISELIQATMPQNNDDKKYKASIQQPLC